MPTRAHLIRVDVLAYVDRHSLTRLLAPFRPFLSRRGVTAEVLAASVRPDRVLAKRILVAMQDDDAPDTLRALLEALDTLASTTGAQELVRLDTTARLPRGTHGHEDLAIVALLDAPDLAGRALLVARAVRAARDPARAYTNCRPRSVRIVVYRAEMHPRLERELAARFEARDSSKFVLIVVSETEEATFFEITHGDRPRTREIVDTRALALSLVTDVSAHRAYAVLDARTGWLSVAAHAPVVKDLVRKAFGTVLAEEEEHFVASELYDLAPFAEPSAALSVEGVQGLHKVELHEMTVVTPKGVTAIFGRGRDDLLAADVNDVIELALSRAAPVGVRLYVTLEGRERASRVDVTAKDGKNVVEMDRDDRELSAVVHAYFLARGVLRPAEAPREAGLRADAGP